MSVAHNVWHWQQNTWSNYNGISRIVGSAKHCIIWGEKNMIELVVNEEREKEICEFETKMFAKYKLLSYRNGVGDIIREQEIS